MKTAFLNKLATRVGEIVPDLRQVQDVNGEVKLQVPLVMQVGGSSCGRIAAFTVMKSLGVKVVIEDVVGPGNRPDEGGMDIRQVQALMREFGVGSSSIPANVTLKGLLRKIDRGEPVILAVRNHWVVLYGFSEKRATVHLANARWVPKFAAVEMPWAKFLRVWDREAGMLAGWRWL